MIARHPTRIVLVCFSFHHPCCNYIFINKIVHHHHPYGYYEESVFIEELSWSEFGDSCIKERKVRIGIKRFSSCDTTVDFIVHMIFFIIFDFFFITTSMHLHQDCL